MLSVPRRYHLQCKLATLFWPLKSKTSKQRIQQTRSTGTLSQSYATGPTVRYLQNVDVGTTLNFSDTSIVFRVIKIVGIEVEIMIGAHLQLVEQNTFLWQPPKNTMSRATLRLKYQIRSSCSVTTCCIIFSVIEIVGIHSLCLFGTELYLFCPDLTIKRINICFSFWELRQKHLHLKILNFEIQFFVIFSYAQM